MITNTFNPGVAELMKLAINREKGDFYSEEEFQELVKNVPIGRGAPTQANSNNQPLPPPKCISISTQTLLEEVEQLADHNSHQEIDCQLGEQKTPIGLVGDTNKVIGSPNENKHEREMTTWLRETWIKEGMPKGSVFFARLKKYLNQTGSPIIEHHTTGKDGGGIRWSTGNATNTMNKKTIQNKVSKFKGEFKERNSQ